MAQESLLDRLLSYLVWGLFVLIACAIAAAVLRRLYSTPASGGTKGDRETGEDESGDR
jgi:hypothetical protein